MPAASIGVNLRVTGHCRQGGRKYMEDFFSVAYQQTEDEKDLQYAFIGIYDGHGGAEAAAFAKEHLMETIVKHRSFWSDDDEDVLRAIKEGYIATHYAMWKEQEKWPKTTSGLPSTAGTTASIAFIRRGKIYIGHVGDSGITLGYQLPGCSEWMALQLTKDHKPENVEEMMRIEQCGGKVVAKSGVPRVVWNRPKLGHQGPVRRSTPIDEIPFLAVARSLGDLWSYNSQLDQFIVSPDPDCSVVRIDPSVHRCLIFGTDGLYNMISPQMAVHIVHQAEKHNEMATTENAKVCPFPHEGSCGKQWLNPSRLLVEKALERWQQTKLRADNTSVVTLMLDPPGPPRAQVLKNRNIVGQETTSSTKNIIEPPQESPTLCLNKLERCEDESKESKDSDLKINPPKDTKTMEECANNNNNHNLENERFQMVTENVTSSSNLSATAFFKECADKIKEHDSTNLETSGNPPDFTINEDSIQINEISSSSGDDSASSFDGDIENSSSNSSTPFSIRKHNLRSSSVGKSSKKTTGDENAKKYAKLKEEQLEGARKSLRINSKVPPKPAETSKNTTLKNISITQSILNAKESEMQQTKNKNKEKKSIGSKSLAKQLKKLIKPKPGASIDNVQKRPPFVALQDTVKKIRTPKSTVLLKEPTPVRGRSRRALESSESKATTSQKTNDRKSSRLREKIAKKSESLRSNVKLRKNQKKSNNNNK